MRYQQIGTSGIEASRVAMGVMRMADKTREEARSVVDAALEAGIDFFDTADVYGDGMSSAALGQALRDVSVDRSQIEVQTKFGIVHNEDAQHGSHYDFSHDHLVDSIDQELRRLQTDYVDFVLLHRFDTLVDVDELAATIDELAETGKVLRFGVSNVGPWTVEMLQAALHQRLDVNQLQFGLKHAGMVQVQVHENMLDDQAIDRDGGALVYSQLRQMTLQAWSPMQYGMFEGHFVDNPKFPELNKKLAEIAEAHDVTKEGVATAWILRHPAKIQVISGSMNPERIARVAAGAGVDLDRQEWYDLYTAAGNELP
ncbi:aldo/keto reductase [Coriobacterium glomerans PW2]|uniref:Aldo/keto reductase n=1 Tax=Coriobacterium glomerans (strain ATCC 49209 / DSM 20642 / JCM 10262 / PW2) TaxID=700015 RepID=F2N889_CORGP|nr:aldo/keto reductase [Coriobacterium glomerans]AEB07272.1 aldo/keto reductase [Coriobacterium glomerans PW2]